MGLTIVNKDLNIAFNFKNLILIPTTVKVITLAEPTTGLNIFVNTAKTKTKVIAYFAVKMFLNNNKYQSTKVKVRVFTTIQDHI